MLQRLDAEQKFTPRWGRIQTKSPVGRGPRSGRIMHPMEGCRAEVGSDDGEIMPLGLKGGARGGRGRHADG